VRIKLGFKTWSTLSAMLISLAVIAGCNDEGASTTPSPTPVPAPGGAPPKGPDMKKPSDMPPPPTPPKDEKPAEKH
jgi:hypothetical protein